MNADGYYDTPHRDDHARDAAVASMQADVATTTRDILAGSLTALAAHIKGGHKVDLPHQIEAAVEEVIDHNAAALDALAVLPDHHGFSRVAVDEQIEAATTEFLTAVIAAVRAYDRELDGAFTRVIDDAEWEHDTRPLWAPLRRTA